MIACCGAGGKLFHTAGSQKARTVSLLGRPFVKRFALWYQTVVCPVCPVLSVTLVYCGQTVGRIKMKLGIQVGLGPGHIVLDGDPAPLPPKGAEPPPLPIFGRYLLRPNGCRDQDATWYSRHAHLTLDSYCELCMSTIFHSRLIVDHHVNYNAQSGVPLHYTVY